MMDAAVVQSLLSLDGVMQSFGVSSPLDHNEEADSDVSPLDLL